jgi:hypothetical protein
MLPKLAFVLALVVLGTIFAADHCGEAYPDCGHEEGAECPSGGPCVENPVTGQTICGGSRDGSGGDSGGGGGPLPTSTPTPPNTPPRASTSQYMYSVSSAASYWTGCQWASNGETGLVILNFGQPRTSGKPPAYGTTIYGPSQAFVSLDDIKGAVQTFAYGYFNCDGSDIELAVGTTNFSGTEGTVTFGHGRAWALMVNEISDYVASQQWGSVVDIFGAIDIEPDWSSVSAGREWVNGYASVWERPYYNFGTAEGCTFDLAFDGSFNDDCNNGWTQDDIWYVSWYVTPAFVIPEIYATTGDNAKAWRNLRVRNYMLISGALTQFRACLQNPNDPSCPGANNTPAEGWSQLYFYLNNPTVLQTSLSRSLDIGRQEVFVP